MSPLHVLVALVLGGVLLLWAYHRSTCWRGASKSGGQLLKGSSGWPIIGETFDIVNNPFLYGTSRAKRYGSIFKSSLFLEPAIVGTTPEFAKFVLSNPKVFIQGVPSTRIVPKSFLSLDGPSHVSIKKFFTKPVLPETLRPKVHVLEEIILQYLSSWEQQGTVVAKEAMQEVMLDTAFYLVIGIRDMTKSAEGKHIQEDFKALMTGVFSAPINLPGTAFYKGMKAKARLVTLLKCKFEERKKKTNIQSTDVFGLLLAARDIEGTSQEVKDLDDDTIAENILAILFAAYDSTTTTLVWVLKMMNGYPDYFRQLQVEQEEILKDKGSSVEGPRLTWDDTRRMVAGRNFFQELQRLLSLGAFVPRIVTEDIEYEGYILPKGWRVMPMASVIHRNPELHPDPSRFNPDRYNGVTPRPFTIFPFGHGPHMCPGGELAKLLVLIMIHHLTTTFTHESAGPDQGTKYIHTFLSVVGGYPIKVRRRN